MNDSARGGRGAQGADRAGTSQDSARDVSVVDERGPGTRARSTGTRGNGSRSNRGFASMDPAKQREIASKGGRAAHEKGTAHEFDSSEARAAGRKGGEVVSRNREHMAEIGRRGGESRGANRSATQRGGGQPRREGNESRSEE
jgi:general stress protein YciG